MKKLGILSVLLCVCMMLSGCTATLALLGVGMLTRQMDQYDSVEDYGIWQSDDIEINYFPANVDQYTVNKYSYTVYTYFDTCYEAFLDVTVTAEQLDALLKAARESDHAHVEQEAWYAEGYYEIVFDDEYTRGDTGEGCKVCEILGDENGCKICNLAGGAEACKVCDICKNASDGLEQVGWATIDKVIFNPETCNVIYVSLRARDENVHDVENIAYFNRFSITPEQYVSYVPEGNSDNGGTINE